MRPLGLRYAGARILHFQDGQFQGAAHAYRDAAASRRVAQGIVDQITQQFTQHHGIAGNHDRIRGLFEAQVDMLGKRRLHPVLHHAARQFAQLDRLERRARLRLVFRARQGQQLVHQARGRFRTFRQLQQRAVNFVVVGLAQGQLGLHAHAGQRRFHLVCGIGDEAFLHVDRQR